MVKGKEHCLWVKNKLLSLIKDHCGDEVIGKSGGILYSSYSTVKPGEYMIFGVNPGGDPAHMSQWTIEYDIEYKYKKSVEGNNKEAWSEYIDEIWNGQKAGESIFQRRIRSMSEFLFGYESNLREICALNSVFIRSKNEKEINYELFNFFWPVHEFLIKMVQPRCIITIGIKPYEFLHKKFREYGSRKVYEKKIPASHGNWKIRISKIKEPSGLVDKPIVILGIPHLSRYEVSGKEQIFDKVKKSLNELQEADYVQ